MEENRKIRILYIPSSIEGGVFYYRCYTPMVKLKEMFEDKYDITITNHIDSALNAIKDIDILIAHNCLYDDNMQVRLWNLIAEAKRFGVKTIIDMDDYWNYGEEHPLIKMCMMNKYPLKAPINFAMFDYVTTTTERLKSEISLYNKNVYILENGISIDDNQFVTDKDKSDKIRIGLTGGSSHTNDIKQIVDEKDCVLDYLGKNIKDRMQFVLCGFDLSGYKIIIQKDGSVKKDKLELKDIWWVNIEKQLTKNYTTISKEYKDLLLKYDGSDEQYDASNEPYRRIWTKKIKDGEYGQIYKDLDILLVPLTDTKFNSMKSQLKFIEAGFTNTAIITSQVAPYIDYGKEYEDCLFVKKPKCNMWAKKIEEIILNDDLRKKITENLHNRVLIDSNMDDLTRKRDKLYTDIFEGKI